MKFIIIPLLIVLIDPLLTVTIYDYKNSGKGSNISMVNNTGNGFEENLELLDFEESNIFINFGE